MNGTNVPWKMDIIKKEGTDIENCSSPAVKAIEKYLRGS